MEERESARGENDPVPKSSSLAKCHGIGETTGEATEGRREGAESRCHSIEVEIRYSGYEMRIREHHDPRAPSPSPGPRLSGRERG